MIIIELVHLLVKDCDELKEVTLREKMGRVGKALNSNGLVPSERRGEDRHT